MAKPKIKYIQLEPAAFLSDEDFQTMSDAERGIYCTVIFYMLCNNGRIKNDPAAIKRLCNSDDNFEQKWVRVIPKLYPKRVWLRHRRVDKELRTARERAQIAYESGVKGASKRWGGNSPSNRVPVAKVSKGKVINKETKAKKFIPPTVEEIDEYCVEKGIEVLPQYIWDFYDSKDWKVGKNKMTKWRTAVSRARYWADAPRRRLPKQMDTKAEDEKLKKQREIIRKEDSKYFREKSTGQLQVFLREKKYITRRWLIKEILAERK